MGALWLMFRRMYGDCQGWKKRYARCRVTASIVMGSGTSKPKQQRTECAPTKNHPSGTSTHRLSIGGRRPKLMMNALISSLMMEDHGCGVSASPRTSQP